jgi:hypothetical protein
MISSSRRGLSEVKDKVRGGRTRIETGRQAFADVSRRPDAGRYLAPEFGITDETVSDSLGLLTGTDLKWFRNQGLIFWHDFT